MSETHMDLAFRQFIATGQVAGNVTVTGIRVGDALKHVLIRETSGAAGDITSQFKITASNTINNTGGASTAAQTLLVGWMAKSPSGPRLDNT